MSRDLRKEQIKIFEDTRQLYETDGKLTESVRYSKKHQEMIDDGADFPILPHREGIPDRVLVSGRRSLEAAGQYCNAAL